MKLAWTFNMAGAVVGAMVVLLCQAAMGQTIPNPSFETDNFATSPGYISVNAPISPPETELSSPMIAFCTVFDSESSTTRSKGFNCANSRLPKIRRNMTRKT